MAPNFLVVLNDDHAQWAAHCYGNSEIRTPTLDFLAETGVLFANAFTPSPVCSPARASFFTGRNPSQHGVHDYLSQSDPEVMATPWLEGESTLAEMLRDAGYVTGLSGKWHLGKLGSPAPGFDFWYSRSAPVPSVDCQIAPWPVQTTPEQRFDHHAVTDKAIEFLRHRDTSRPFLLVVGYFSCHSPWRGQSERFVRQYRQATFADIPEDATYPFGRLRSESLYPSRNDPRETLAQYYASVTEVDEQVGRLVDELEMSGNRDDTAVIYTSDHGLNTGHHGIWGKGNGTLPYNVVDESIRVPLIVNWPDRILGRQRRSENVTHTDTFMTILDLASLSPDQNRHVSPYPGRSYADALMGKSLPDARDYVFAEYGNLRMVRSTGFKLVRRYPSGPDQLFDLKEDPRESRNVLDSPHCRQEQDALDEELNRYFSQYQEPGREGTDVDQQPRHNGNEAWRDNGEHRLVEDPVWLDRLEREIRQ